MTVPAGSNEVAQARLVVDASLAAKWVLAEDRTQDALALLADWQAQGSVLTVPGWFACEVTNVLYKRVWRQEITVLDAQVGIETLLTFVEFHEIEPEVSKRALEIAASLGRPATYDSHYVALSEQLGCELWTADERFWNAVGASFPWVKWVGQFAASGGSSNPSGASPLV